MLFEVENVDELSIAEICRRIERLTVSMTTFWKSAHGWAPAEAAGLLNKSMLEWQGSLSGSLSGWLDSTSDGDLILAWANLGALVEGQLRLFLSVYYEDYKADADAIVIRGRTRDPDEAEATLERLRQFYAKRIWSTDADWNPYVQTVQQRRNAIHAFRARDIGDFDEWQAKVRQHLLFLRELNTRMPYPDDVYVPRES